MSIVRATAGLCRRAESFAAFFAVHITISEPFQTNPIGIARRRAVLGHVGQARDATRQKLGFRLDADFAAGEDFRVVQLTPPGSECSIIIGDGLTTASPGSIQGLHLIVGDIEKAHADLAARGVDVSEVFHDIGGIFHHAGTEGRVAGPDPDHRDYGSFASFSNPDGNGWLLQEVSQRAPGR